MEDNRSSSNGAADLLADDGESFKKRSKPSPGAVSLGSTGRDLV